MGSFQIIIRMCVANMCTISICDQVCKTGLIMHIQFCDFEDTELSLWVSYRYTNLTQERLGL